MKAEEFKTVKDLRKMREDCLIKAYEKTATEMYNRVFLPNGAEDKLTLNAAENFVNRMDSVFEKEWRYIGELFCETEESEESDD